MRFDKFTVKAQEAVQRAHELAQQGDHPEALPLHVLAALLGEEEGVVGPLLQKIYPSFPTWNGCIACRRVWTRC